ncbi:MAG: hypothetical protein SGBAC_011213 [Bacillariaceae sp.]
MYDESKQLPWRLHILLEEADRNGDSSATISWLPDGDAFKVHNKVEFENVLMPKYFKSSKFKSFQRSLNLWGFQTLTKDPDKGAIFHPDFLRGKPDRCKLMKRVRVKKKSPKMSLKEFHAAMHVKTTACSSSPRAPDAEANPSTHQTSDSKVLQSKQMVQQDSDRLQQGPTHCQTSGQEIAQLSNLTRPSSQPVCHRFLKRAPSTEHYLSSSRSFGAIHYPLLLNPVNQTQAPAPPLFTSPWSEHTAVMASELDRLKNRIGWALLVTNSPLLLLTKAPAKESDQTA